jgi:hypothetical protein
MLPNTNAISNCRHGSTPNIFLWRYLSQRFYSWSRCGALRSKALTKPYRIEEILNCAVLLLTHSSRGPTPYLQNWVPGLLGMCFNDNFKPKIVSCTMEYTGQVWWFTVPQGCSSQPTNCSPSPPRPLPSALMLEYIPGPCQPDLKTT